MIKARDLEDGTRAAAKEEQLRKKRIEDRQKMVCVPNLKQQHYFAHHFIYYYRLV